MTLNLAKFRKQFFLEAREKLGAIQGQMVELEQNPRQAELKLALRRNVHTVKGSARMVGLERISKLAHLLEDLFDCLQQKEEQLDQETVDAIYQGLDALGVLLDEAETGLDLPAETPLPPASQALQEIIKKCAENKNKVEEKETEKPRVKKFQLDFQSMRRHLAATGNSEKEEKTPPSTLNKPEQTGPAVVEKKPDEAKAPQVQPRLAEQPTPLIQGGEKKYLKVEAERIEGIVNQVTDLLTRRYSFRLVSQKLQDLSRLLFNLKQEFHQLDQAKIPDENTTQFENLLGLAEKSLVELEKSYEFSSLQFFNLLSDACANLLELKLTPLSSIMAIYPRFARDMAYRNGKKVRLFMRGCDLELDKSIVEKIGEPLVHLLRNALDHGIEDPESRKEKGKDPVATIIVEAGKTGTQAFITISDDGGGLNREAIVKKAVQQKIIKENEAARLSDQEVYQLIFTPGLSTSSQISEISGRGLGMDIVRKTLQQLNGRVFISSTPEKGTTFRLEFPVSVFITNILIIEDEGRRFAIPSSLVEGLQRVKAETLKKSGHETVAISAGHSISLRKLSRIMGYPQAPDNHRKEYFILIPRVTDQRIAILLDEVIQETDAIIKDTGSFLGKQPFVHGITIDEKGSLVIVLDLYDLTAPDNFRPQPGTVRSRFSGSLAEKESEKQILVVDDSLPIREMLRNILEQSGFYVNTATNGMEGFQKAMAGHFDLILSDIEMPEMDGFEMLENLKKNEIYRDIPVIVLSTRENESDKARGLRIGASAWLSKQTFAEKDFIRLVKSLVD